MLQGVHRGINPGVQQHAVDIDFHTLEGNAHGEGPEGRIEGVIKRTRNMSTVAHIYRLLSEDYDA